MPKLVDTAAATFHAVVPDLAPDLRAALVSCIGEQRRAHARFRPDPDPERHVSEDALRGTLTEHRDVSDVRTDPSLSNCLVFHTGGLPGSVDDPAVVGAREEIDEMVAHLLASSLDGIAVADAVASGHFWYPPGAYMGWHTNSRVPGWRAYLTWAAEPHRSFFRYAEPSTGDVLTSWDTAWDLRVFKVEAERPLWHAVCSHTDRFSFGYRIVEP
ncbi:MAG TPA: hypothetical protein VEP49_06585 [Acidimicrobiia bacterium]|nr:hypothetical protein [Acidimicrobiia bacterium]